MRLSLPLQQTLQSFSPPWNALPPVHLPWLRSLKTAQLQHLAQKTGIPSSGPKAALVRNLECGLGECYFGLLPPPPPPPDAPAVVGTGDAAKKPNASMSILSIDMGIRNLAFCHLLVDPASPHSREEMAMPSVKLNAWNRISLPPRMVSPAEFAQYLASSFAEPDPGPDPGTGSEREKEESFPLHLYATHAYVFLSTLLARYRPTHVLIERQRFRSAGASAVQEWSLRVGVFEGMLYAVLVALRQQQQQQQQQRRQQPGSGLSPWVVGVEPARVGRYWASSAPPNTSIQDCEIHRKKSTTNEGKRVKIDLVAGWLENGRVRIPPGNEGEGEGDQVGRWVDGYLARWRRSRSGSRKEKVDVKAEAKERKVDVGKLDDLADCLVQGVTWLEWQVMRERVVREGGQAFGLDLP